MKLGILVGAFVVATSFLGASSAGHAATCSDLFQPRSGDLTVARESSRQLSSRRIVASAKAQERIEKFVKIRGDRELWVDFLKPEPGKPVVVLVNGLTYRTGIWDTFVDKLKGDGLGILRYDPRGMGETMIKEGFPKAEIPIAEQARDLNSLLSKLGLRTPVHIVTLSYGGALGTLFSAMYPGKVESLVLMAPYTQSLKAQDDQILLQIAATRAMFPLNPATNDQLFDFFLKQTVYSTYALTEPIVLEHPYKLEAIFRMIQGVRKFRAEDVVDKLPAGKVHLVVAAKDQYIPQDVLDVFWNRVPAAAKASRLYLQHTEHKIPEAMPGFSAEWIKLIINKDPRIQNGGTWVGGVWSGGVDGGTTRIEIPQQ